MILKMMLKPGMWAAAGMPIALINDINRARGYKVVFQSRSPIPAVSETGTWSPATYMTTASDLQRKAVEERLATLVAGNVSPVALHQSTTSRQIVIPVASPTPSPHHEPMTQIQASSPA